MRGVNRPLLLPVGQRFPFRVGLYILIERSAQSNSKYLKTAANGGGFFAAGPDGEELPLRDLLPEELVSVSVSREMIEKYRTGRTEMRYRYYPALRRPSLYEEP